MNTPAWLNPGLKGAAAGAAALAIVGFTWGGWGDRRDSRGNGLRPRTPRSHRRLGADLPRAIQKGSNVVETLAELKAAGRYQRNEMFMNTGWATMPGSGAPDRRVATACLEKLAAHF